MNRVLNAVRMQYANATAYFWVPAVIAVAATVVVVLIGAIISHEGQPIYSGAANAPFWFFATAGIQAIILVFPFSLAMGVTRWEFSVSTLLAAMGAGGLLALFATILGWFEKLTVGWYVDAYVFYLPWFWQQGAFVAWLLFASFAIVLFQIGFAFAVLYKRYGMMLMVSVMILITALLVVVPVWFISTRDLWAQTLQFFAGLAPLSVSLVALLVSVAISGLGYLALRKYEVR